MGFDRKVQNGGLECNRSCEPDFVIYRGSVQSCYVAAILIVPKVSTLRQYYSYFQILITFRSVKMEMEWNEMICTDSFYFDSFSGCSE